MTERSESPVSGTAKSGWLPAISAPVRRSGSPPTRACTPAMPPSRRSATTSGVSPCSARRAGTEIGATSITSRRSSDSSSQSSSAPPASGTRRGVAAQTGDEGQQARHL